MVVGGTVFCVTVVGDATVVTVGDVTSVASSEGVDTTMRATTARIAAAEPAMAYPSERRK
jgi:hypothetical protein